MSAEHEAIDLRLLGPVRAWRDGVELTLGSARRTALFCVLALHAGHAVSREQLVAAVWGENAPASAMGNVYTYVSALRQILEPARGRWASGQLLASGGGTYRLHVPPESVDVVRFESLREEARRHRGTGDVTAELAALESALRLWRGEPLAGVPGPFAEAQRLRLAEFRLVTAERYAALLAETGRHEAAARMLREFVDEYPTRAALRTMLAATLRAAGRGADAADVLGGDSPVAPGARAAPASGSRGRPALIGRHDEVRRLRRAAAEAGALARGHGIRVEGGPGIGKSALLAAALGGTGRTGWAFADESAQRLPLGVLLECVESALGDDPHHPLVAQLRAVAADALRRPAAEVVDAAADLIRRAAEEAPLVLVADDVQWADPFTLRVWAALRGREVRLPLLLVAAVRAGAPEVRGLPADEVLELAPLDRDAATALVRAVAPEPPEPRRLGRILDDAGGNPCYLRLLATGEPGGGDVTATVGVHLAPLPEQTRQLLRVVAFLGAYELTLPGGQPVGCTVAELATVTDRDRDELTGALEPARQAGMLTATGDRLEFRHRIVARTLHEATPAALRVSLHRSFAERIAASGGPPEQVVAQLLAGNVPLDERAGAWLVEYAQPLAERAPQIAIIMFQRARAQHALDSAQRLSLTAWLARLLLRQQRNAAVEAGWVAARTNDPDLEGEMRWVTASAHEQRGRFEAAAEVARAALREHRIAPRWTERLRALLARVRPHLPGDPTTPQLSRSALVDEANPRPW